MELKYAVGFPVPLHDCGGSDGSPVARAIGVDSYWHLGSDQKGPYRAAFVRVDVDRYVNAVLGVSADGGYLFNLRGIYIKEVS